MIGSFKLDGGIQKILIVALILIVGGYLYLEIRKLSHEVMRLKQSINRESNKYDIEAPTFVKNTHSQIVTQESGRTDARETFAKASEQASEQIQENAQGFQLPGLQSLQSLMESSEIDEQSSLVRVEELDCGESESHTNPQESTLTTSVPEEVDETIPDTVETIPDLDETIEELEETIPDNEPDDIKIITHDQDPYREKTVSELKAILQEKGLPLSGNKTKLINRIKENVTVEKQQEY